MTFTGQMKKEISLNLVNFFTFFGIDSNVVRDTKGIILEIIDTRFQDCLIRYSLRLVDVVNVLIDNFVVITPHVNIVLGDDMIEVFIESDTNKNFVLAMYWVITSPIILSINYEFLREIIEHPSKFFLLVKLYEKTSVDGKWINRITRLLDDYKLSLSKEQESMLHETLSDIEKIKLNTIVETVKS